MRLLRLAKIWLVSLKYGLDEFLTGHERFRAVRPLARALTFWRDMSAPRAVRLRLALEELGPIFVKFGQMLSTRRDLLPPDIADELAQAAGPRAAVSVGARRRRRSSASTASRSTQVFSDRSNATPVASASVAQVHFAELPDGTPVAVKVLRPDIAHVIEHDLALMHAGAMLVEKLWSRRQAAEAARGRRRIREDDPRRARPLARGGQLLAAAAQLPALAAAARARSALGLQRPAT